MAQPPPRWLDVVMNEDQDRTHMGYGPHNLAVLRPMAINAMQKEGSKGSSRGEFKRAGWDDGFLHRYRSYFEMRLPWLPDEPLRPGDSGDATLLVA